MTPKITPEIADALQSGAQPLEVIDPKTNHVYLVFDPSSPTFFNDLQQRQDYEAIAEGVRQMEAGEGRPLNEALDELRTKLVARYEQ